MEKDKPMSALIENAVRTRQWGRAELISLGWIIFALCTLVPVTLLL